MIIRGEEIVPIEIKSKIMKPVISLGLRNFIEKYSPERAVIVNLSLEKRVKVGKTRVDFIYPFRIRDLLTSF